MSGQVVDTETGELVSADLSPVLDGKAVQEMIDLAERFLEAGPRATPDWAADRMASEGERARDIERSLDVVLWSDTPLHVYGWNGLRHSGKILLYPAPYAHWWTVTQEPNGDLCRSMDRLAAEHVPQALACHGAIPTAWRCVSSPVFTAHPFGTHGAPEGDMDRRHVYFVQGAQTKNLKIGLATDVDRRVSQLQNASSERLNLVGVIPHGGRATERAWLEAYSADRLHGEWFSPSDALIEAVRFSQEASA